jgi:hypothetical protein
VELSSGKRKEQLTKRDEKYRKFGESFHSSNPDCGLARGHHSANSHTHQENDGWGF